MEDLLAPYNIIWNTPSRDSSESMPCGGYDIGLNVWVEAGDLLFYIDRTGSFDENNQMLKLGRVRVRLSPNPFTPGAKFRQTLHLQEGYIEVWGKTSGVEATLRIWVETARPVIHVDVESNPAVTLTATYENWRTADHPLSKEERMACLSFLMTSPEKIPLTTYADTFEPGPNSMLWFHRNRNDDLVFDKEVTQQHLDSVRAQLWNPQKDLTFGGLMHGENLVFTGTQPGKYQQTAFTGWVYQSVQPERQHSVKFSFYTAQAADIDAWKTGLHALVDAAQSDAESWQQHLDWWAAFWQRSYIAIRPENPNPKDPVWQTGRNYQLFRFLMGCNAAGTYPTKFNGGLWTYDPHLILPRYHMATPDFRQWGGGSFTAMNQRLMYWPLLKSGDFALMPQQFDFYRRALPNAELRVRVYWGHEGACFTEQMENFGLPLGDIYQHRWGDGGLGPRANGEPGWLDNQWCEDLYDTVLEFSLMMLDYQRYAGLDLQDYIPVIDSAVTFFDQHYQYQRQNRKGQPLDEDDRLEIYPGTACETYKRATNPVTTVSALRAVLKRLLELPEQYGTHQQRDSWAQMLERIPDLPIVEKDGRRMFAPAKSWERISNIEFPHLYPLFPYRLYGLGKPDLDIALNTWRYGTEFPEQRQNMCWHQDPIFCALLGLTEEAAALVSERMADAPTRFPAFWGIGHDWTPDLDHPGAGAIALQEMLMQVDGKTIRLLPAWPDDWDVSFRLHAPYQTVVSGEVRQGKLTRLSVTPEARRADIIIGNL